MSVFSDKLPSIEEEAILIPAAATDKAKLAEVIEKYSILVEVIVKQFAKKHGKYIDDMRQEAFIGLIKSVHGFKPELENRFYTYATHMIRGYIMMYLRTLRENHQNISLSAINDSSEDGELSLESMLSNSLTWKELPISEVVGNFDPKNLLHRKREKEYFTLRFGI